MNCRELQNHLQPYVDGEFSFVEQAEIEQHLSECPSCSEEVAQTDQYKLALRRHAQKATPTAPIALRAKILRAVDEESKPSSTHRTLRYLPWAAAVVVVSAVGVGTTFSRRQHLRYLEDAAVGHSRSLPMEISQESPDRVEAWFGGKLDHRVPVPQLAHTTLAGGRLSNVQEHPAAYLRYDTATQPGEPPRRIGLFVFDDAKGDVAAKPLPSVEVAKSRGYNVAVWRDGELVYQLVSDLDESEIRRIIQEGATRPLEAAQPPAELQVQPASLQE